MKIGTVMANWGSASQRQHGSSAEGKAFRMNLLNSENLLYFDGVSPVFL